MQKVDRSDLEVVVIGLSPNSDEIVEAREPSGHMFAQLRASARELAGWTNFVNDARAYACEYVAKKFFLDAHEAGSKFVLPRYRDYWAVRSLMRLSGLRIIKAPGGSSANTAMTLGKLLQGMDVKIKLLGSVGDDRAGRKNLEAFRECGIQLVSTSAQIQDRTHTNLVIFSHEHQDRWIAKDSSDYDDSFFRKAIDAVSGFLDKNRHENIEYPIEPVDVPSLLEKPSLVVLLAQLAEKKSAEFDEILNKCLQKNIPIALSPPTSKNYAPALKQQIIDALPNVDVFLCNAGELCALFGKNTQDSLEEIRKIYAAPAQSRTKEQFFTGEQVAFVTNGNGTKYIVTKGSVDEIHTIQSPKVVNTLGAGDTFAAGVLAMLARGASHNQAALFGSVLATCAVEQLHAVVDQPMEAVRAFLDRVDQASEGHQDLEHDYFLGGNLEAPQAVTQGQTGRRRPSSICDVA